MTEDRDGSAGAVPSVWGLGGHVGAPMSVDLPAVRVTEERHGFAGALPSGWGLGALSGPPC